MNYSFLKSRTVWTLIFMFIVGGLNGVINFLPPGIVAPLMGFLSLLGVYFHVNPTQTYNPVAPN